MQVLQIRPREQISVDQDRLGALYTQLGEAGAEDVVCRALEDLARRLTQCEQKFRDAAWPDLQKSARSLIAVADQIGMADLAKVAGDVVQCVANNDATALAATLSRLFRIGERSLTAIWDIDDMPE
ncbi:hypothetical protein JQV27_10930 [Sulfitobacter mediterraneus]|jgi:hypothetical protein|uniref:hypothetical protein n=1 Tax=Sulfitobacter TaxID=60136 RepID=UPI001932643E|nr:MULTISPECIES: hypothetical protein [Sulfitobacter]MBM1632722.1 hypothetical protein [Sulfitobacter mediterraneus]MBM1641144.1 hypothetical protein [Sulfitobacter mediterraneus]MBM1644587.1 hypothetical protein [Sulfitobacter mediterraneus]MBM1649264.1 hypothetical protein [Sulfitobacter mediterraneus]MBM1653285.1 hypothetical protein [Sulfitobacter mediterraneus]